MAEPVGGRTSTDGLVASALVCLLVATGVILYSPYVAVLVSTPLLLVSFILSVVALFKGRTAPGVALLLGIFLGAPFLWMGAFHNASPGEGASEPSSGAANARGSEVRQGSSSGLAFDRLNRNYAVRGIPPFHASVEHADSGVILHANSTFDELPTGRRETLKHELRAIFRGEIIIRDRGSNRVLDRL